MYDRDKKVFPEKKLIDKKKTSGDGTEFRDERQTLTPGPLPRPERLPPVNKQAVKHEPNPERINQFLTDKADLKEDFYPQLEQAREQWKTEDIKDNFLKKYGVDVYNAVMKLRQELQELGSPGDVQKINWLNRNYPEYVELLNEYDSREEWELSKPTVWGKEVNAQTETAAFNRVLTALANGNFNQAARLLQNMPESLRPGVINRILGMRHSESVLSSLSLDTLKAQLEGAIKNPTPAIPQHLQQQMSAVQPGPWNPGKQNPAFYLGNKAHEQIADEYRNANPGQEIFTNNSNIRTLVRQGGGNLKGLSPTQLAFKPDITNLTKMHIYEIKPSTQLARGLSECVMYEATLNMAGVPVKAGPTNAPGTQGTIPAPGGVYVYWAAVPGVIVYQYKRGPQSPVLMPALTPQESKTEDNANFMKKLELATGLTGIALILYLVTIPQRRLIVPLRNIFPMLAEEEIS